MLQLHKLHRVRGPLENYFAETGVTKLIFISRVNFMNDGKVMRIREYEIFA